MKQISESIDETCSFCAEIHDLNVENNLFVKLIAPQTNLKSRIIYRSKDFLVMPTIGAFAEGYLLIVSRKHYMCIGQLSKPEIRELTLQIKMLKEKIEKCYHKKVVLFEHGSTSCSNKVGGCIAHAHLHMVPCDRSMNEYIQKYGLKYHEISSLEELCVFAEYDTPYLFWEEIDGTKYVISNEVIPSQFFRKILADIYGVPQKWDWRQEHYIENIEKTMNAMKTME